MDLKEEQILGADVGAHWYYRAKAALLKQSLHHARRVLDIGAGSAYFARVLAESGLASAVDCVDPGYRDSVPPAPAAGARFRFLETLPTDEGAYDTALLMDVLEHVDDELALLQPLRRLLGPGGRLFITVPAFQWLWSGHDVFLEHRRRYTRASLLEVVRRAGLVPQRCHYFYGLIFPLACLQRIASRAGGAVSPRSALRRHHPATNAVLYALCRAELPIARFNRLAGLSVVCVASPPADAGG
jgi:2-polyprenyl-3-methyl-5-hydroxy-6-metoxy-1,4-benzoquinol methylase